MKKFFKIFSLCLVLLVSFAKQHYQFLVFQKGLQYRNIRVKRKTVRLSHFHGCAYSSLLADRRGFEPPDAVNIARFPSVCLKPLDHLSIV